MENAEKTEKTDRVTALLTELAGAQALERLIQQVLANITPEQQARLTEALVARFTKHLDDLASWDLHRLIGDVFVEPMLREAFVAEIKPKLQEALEKATATALANMGARVEEEVRKASLKLAEQLSDRIRQAAGIR